ncbi:MAG: DNA/RNA nuclease SfsA [Firmicutes bacterium]|nr:DNA/RNA nuclease SfsA [Bacillota bacterium]
MRYSHIRKGEFLRRPNRFIAHVLLNGEEVICHVKNTGRLKELLLPGATVFLEESDNTARKTRFDLVAVMRGDAVVNIDSQAPNQAVGDWLRKGGLFEDVSHVKAETRYGASRFDFYIESASGRKAFLEVKGVTLLQEDVARFPDAPTTRGIKHIEELVKCMEDGYEAYILFLLEMKGSRWMEPNDATHPAFGKALREAAAKGVNVLAYDCIVTPDRLEVAQPVEVCL